jgi:hypothetical protein
VKKLTILIKCAIPVFQGLLPEPHNTKVLRLLFTFAHWHGLAKLRMHTDATLQILDVATTDLGEQLRAFQRDTCASFETFELKREAEARKRREAKQGSAQTTVDSSRKANQRRRKTFNLQTYKIHALGDYVSTIRMLGTTDSYTTAIASISVSCLEMIY